MKSSVVTEKGPQTQLPGNRGWRGDCLKEVLYEESFRQRVTKPRKNSLEQSGVSEVGMGQRVKINGGQRKQVSGCSESC